MSAPSPHRRELRQVLLLATPIALAQIGMQALSMVDVMMLGRLTEAEGGQSAANAMAAAGVGSTFALALQMPTMGILMALDPLVAQAYGAQNHDRVARALRRGLMLSLLMALPLVAMSFFCEPLLRLFRQDEQIIPLASGYVTAVMPGVAIQLFFFAFRQTLQAMSITRPMLWTVIFANLANVLFNLYFVFGWFGGPAMGVVGSGIATSLSRGLMVALLLLVGWKWLGPYLKRSVAPNRLQDYLHTLSIGIPLGVQVSLEVWIFAAVALCMGNLGEMAMSGHQVAISLASISFMIPLSVGMAAATRVGNAIGRCDPEGVRRSSVVSLAVGIGFMGVGAAAFLFFPRLLARAYTPDPEVIAAAAALLPVAAAFQLFDGAQVVCLGILRGAADTRAPALINFVGYWLLGLPVGWWLTFRAGAGPQGLWWGLSLGLGACAVALALRVRHRLNQPLMVLEDPDGV